MMHDREAELPDYLCYLCQNPITSVYQTRQSIRHTYQMPADPYGDCMGAFFCFYCLACQNHREVRERKREGGGQGLLLHEEAARPFDHDAMEELDI
eukprot:CAMPEP_0114609994 /NCGR_PEP_ID=MMETSP0168-20121206/3371_1 /TAXON_ID=95228 ORGANISM="Vannella sp., Strain DIVA3 517/6/12" /NCGR_SAMPLE_ID=MMETSP0168 /ASSEMBLY_ACC=CAM_ASM_000044 /LENGTH=95 /DNA_ID=CAMNT_0001820921 /DNA_START=110 /DNA_END=397 /DNA_ORIENTATION=+